MEGGPNSSFLSSVQVPSALSKSQLRNSLEHGSVEIMVVENLVPYNCHATGRPAAFAGSSGLCHLKIV